MITRSCHHFLQTSTAATAMPAAAPRLADQIDSMIRE